MKRNQDRAPQGGTRPYIPKAFGNRSLPKSERIECTLLTPTLGEKREILIKNAQPGESEVAAKLRWQEESCRRFVVAIGPYEEAHKLITNGTDLADFGAIELVSEIGMELLGEFSLLDEEKKRLDADFDSSIQGTPASHGVAENASRTNATSPADVMSAPAALGSSTSSKVSENSSDAPRPGSETKTRDLVI